MLRRIPFLFLLAALSMLVLDASPAVAKGGAKATRTIEVSRARLTLGHILPEVADSDADVDLGKAPAPNGSRIVKRVEIEKALEEAGVTGVENIPASVRVVRKMQRLDPKELTELVEQALEARGLKAGMTLTAVKPPKAVKVAAGWQEVSIKLAKNPRRAGKWSTSVTLELDSEGERVARINVPVTFELTEEASKPDIAKGDSVMLSVQTDRVMVTVKATAGGDADVGEKFPVQIKGGKVVMARLIAKNKAVVGGGQ
jgi:hypothetical protein